MDKSFDIPRGMTQGQEVTTAFVPLDPLGTNAPRNSVFARAEGLGLRTRLGCPYAGMDIELHRGELTALRGRNGSGKTALLLTLAGRMAHTEGTLSILGEKMPKGHGRVQSRIGLGLIEGVNDIQSNLTVFHIVAAEFELHGKKAKREDVMRYLREWGLEGVSRMRARDLSRERFAWLGIVLGMVGDPDGLAVDDIEDQLTRVQSERLMAQLQRIAHEKNVAVTVACTERSLADMADRVYHLG